MFICTTDEETNLKYSLTEDCFTENVQSQNTYRTHSHAMAWSSNLHVRLVI